MGCSRVLVLQIEIQSQTFELKKILLQYTVLITRVLGLQVTIQSQTFE